VRGCTPRTGPAPEGRRPSEQRRDAKVIGTDSALVEAAPVTLLTPLLVDERRLPALGADVPRRQLAACPGAAGLLHLDLAQVLGQDAGDAVRQGHDALGSEPER